MKPLQIEETTARNLYKTGSAEFKQLLEDTFGKQFFSEKVTDRIKTYEDACSALGEQPIKEDELKEKGFTNDEIVYRKIKTITNALNEGHKANWEDENEFKWYPYFRVSPSGFVFCDSGCSYSYANAGDAVRLCFKSEELATYAGKQFTDLYKNFIL